MADDDVAGTPDTETAIKADTRHSDPQKQALLSVYRSYIAESH